MLNRTLAFLALALFAGFSVASGVVEYRHPPTNQQFFTIRADEGTAIEKAGWARERTAFESGGSAKVCQLIDDNSFAHYWRLCSNTKLPGDGKWRNEGEVFNASAPNADGHCTGDLMPIIALGNTPKTNAGLRFHFAIGHAEADSYEAQGLTRVGTEFCVGQSTTVTPSSSDKHNLSVTIGASSSIMKFTPATYDGYVIQLVDTNHKLASVLVSDLVSIAWSGKVAYNWDYKIRVPFQMPTMTITVPVHDAGIISLFDKAGNRYVTNTAMATGNGCVRDKDALCTF